MSQVTQPQGRYEAGPIAFDLDQVARVLAELDLGTPTALTKLPGGKSWAFRVERVGALPLVLKAFNDTRPHATGKEIYAARLVAGLDLPVTHFLATDETRTRLPFRFTLANYLPGVQVIKFKDEPDVADLYRQMGALLRQLHAVPVQGYGLFDENGLVDPVATNTEYVARFFAFGFECFRHYGGGETLARRLEEIVAAHADVIAYGGGAVFAHDDLQPNNVLAERDANGRLRLTGLVDFGTARATDSICDLAKSLFCSEDLAPGSATVIREGYGPIDHPDPDAAIWIYMLMHRLTMWWWLRHVDLLADGEDHHLMTDLRAMAAAGTHVP